MNSPFVQLTLVKLREYTREPEAMFWVFVFPVLMTCALGIAFRDSGASQIRVGVVPGFNAEAVAAALDADPRIEARAVTESQAAVLLRDGDIALVVVPQDLIGPSYRFDRTRPESSVARFTVDEVLQRHAGRADVFDPRDELIELPGSRYIDWLVPGLLGMNIMSTGLWGVGFAIVQARTKKLLKRLVATPMSKAHYLMSHVFSRLLFLALEVLVIVGFAWLFFDVKVHGALASLAGLALLGALSFGGLGLLLASRARTIEAVSGLMNLVMLPMWVLSGVFFASANFPEPMQPFIKLLPLTALNDALRAVINEGLAISAVGPEIAILAGWGLVSFALSLRLFRWQ